MPEKDGPKKGPNFSDKMAAVILYLFAAPFLLGGIWSIGRQVYGYLETGQWQAWSLRHLVENGWPWLSAPDEWFGLHNMVYGVLDLMPVSLVMLLIGGPIWMAARSWWDP